MPLLSFYTHGYISKTTVQKNENLELETFEKKVYGNVSIGISTVNEDAFKLYGNQSVVLHEDTGAMQDEKVLDYQRKQSAGIITTYSENLFISRMQNIQRVLQPITVRNPYALELQLPQQIQQKQITNFQYLKLIEVITFLKQYQRTVKVDETTGEEYIETSLEDIADANELLINIMVTKSDKLNQNTRKFLEKLKEYLINKQARTFTNQELSRNLLTPRSTVKRYLSMLVEFDYVRYTGEGNNKVGLELEMVSMDEYKELIDSVTCIMKTNFSQVDHLQSGQSKGVEKNELSQVVQKNEEVGTLSAEASGINKQKDKLQGVESKTKKRVA
jgi:phage terminase small subunit